MARVTQRIIRTICVDYIARLSNCCVVKPQHQLGVHSGYLLAFRPRWPKLGPVSTLVSSRLGLASSYKAPGSPSCW
jgi:hypothetical protein